MPTQVVYVTATFPYVVIVVLIIRGATLEGSLEGVRFYLSADWSRLWSARVGLPGAGHSLSLCVCFCVSWGGGEHRMAPRRFTEFALLLPKQKQG